MDEQNLDLDPQQYLRALQVDATTMVAIIWSLASAAFRKPEGALARKLERMRDAGRALEEGRRAHEAARAKEDPRPYDLTLDRAWAAMIARLQAWGQLPEAGHTAPQADAARLLEVLASDGLAALTLPYKAQWATLKLRLDAVHAEGLDEALTELAGAPFVAAVRRAFTEYGRVLGVTREAEDVSLPNLGALLRAAQQRVGEYVLQVLASADSDDPASVAAASRALRPLQEARDAANAARKAPAAKPDAKPDAKPAADPVVASPRKTAPPPARPSAPPPA
ncbi:MAG: hypothetical protein U0324_39215 [Polyangiales bacterium]